MKEGRPHRADQLLFKLLAGDGAEDPSVLHYAGIARYRCSRFDEAAALLRQATQAAPTYAEAHNSLGILLLETGQTAEARAVLERAVALRPDYANAHTSLGNALSTAGELEGATTAYRRAIALDPYDLQAHHPTGTNPSGSRLGRSRPRRLHRRARHRPVLPECAGDPRARGADWVR